MFSPIHFKQLRLYTFHLTFLTFLSTFFLNLMLLLLLQFLASSNFLRFSLVYSSIVNNYTVFSSFVRYNFLPILLNNCLAQALWILTSSVYFLLFLLPPNVILGISCFQNATLSFYYFSFTSIHAEICNL